MKPSGKLFLERKQSRGLGVHVREASRKPRGWGPPPYWARPLSRGPLEHPPTAFFRLYIPIYPKNIEYKDRSGVPPPQASVATKNLSGARSGTLPEGELMTHKCRGSIVVLSISKSVEPNEEQKEMIRGFQ